jgi:hypothetical protein
VRTVLGLSKTSTSIGWVLVDENDIGGDPLDHDTFDLAELNCADPAATARRACAIATATGYTVDRVHITTTDLADADSAPLREALAGADFEVVVVPLTMATKAWATGAARASGHDTTAVCILDREAISLSIVDVRDDTMQNLRAPTCDSGAMIDWLTTAFGVEETRPQSLFVIGSRPDIESVVHQLNAQLAIPVVATREAQVVLARGAAISDVAQPTDDVAGDRSRFTWRTRTLAGAAVAVAISLFALSGAAGPLSFSHKDAANTPAPPPLTQAALVYAPPPAPPDAVPPEVTAEQSVPTPVPQAAPVVADVVPSQESAGAVPETVPVTPPVEHLPAPQAADHLPEAQPVPLLGPAQPPAATPEIVGPAVPPGPVVPPTPTSPPAPTDPIGSLFFGALP